MLGSALTFEPKKDYKYGWVYKDYNFGLGRSTGAPVKSGASNVDKKACWTADFAQDTLGLPVSYHEFREITPGVWLGWSYFFQKINPLLSLPVHGNYVITE